jgi:hypothetical protein
VNKPDPYYVKLYERYQNFITLNFPNLWDNNSELIDAEYPLSRRFSRPTNSSHIWEANIGTNWAEGRHIIEVKAKDRYGRTFTEFHTMRVTK